jgi:Uma2 family endonuclease
MAITLIPSSSKQTQHIVLEGVSWATYQALLHDLGDRRSSRLAYDRGTLEIIMPSDLHEFISRFLEALVRVLAEESEMGLRGYGSTTLDREDLEQGAEPDACFYIQSVGRILGKKLDITTDPPPDLAVEVDITSSSRRRFGVYLQLQIPEVWRYTKPRGVVIYQLQKGQLQDGEYVECEFSPAFPTISGAVLQQFLQLADTKDDISVVRSLRQWLKTQNAPPSA